MVAALRPAGRTVTSGSMTLIKTILILNLNLKNDDDDDEECRGWRSLNLNFNKMDKKQYPSFDFIIHSLTHQSSLVKLKVHVSLLYLRLVTLFNILAQDHVAILADGVHSSFLANGRNLCSTQFIRSRHDYKGGREGGYIMRKKWNNITCILPDPLLQIDSSWR